MKFLVLNSSTAASLPVTLINWIFGFGVIQYPIGRPWPVVSAFWSALIFLAYLIALRTANFPEMVEIQGSRIAASNYRVTAYLCAAFVAVSMCLAFFRSKLVQESFIKLTNMNVRLKILGVPEDYKLTVKFQIVLLSVGFTWIFAIAILDFKYSGFEFTSGTSRTGFFISFHNFLAFAFVVDCSFISSIRYIGNRFKRLNALLIESDPQERRKTTILQSDTELFRYSSVIHEIHGNSFPSIGAANKQWLLHVIKETRKIHRVLCKTAVELNRAFGIQLLFSVALSFFLIVTLLYTSYILGTSKNLTKKIWQEKIIVLLWITFHASKFLLIVYACETTRWEANWTGKLTTKLLNTRVHDEDIRDEINIFSLQLLKNPLVFTASGFFRFNYSLVRGMLGSATTYLVIMIQMRSIYDSRNMDSASNSTMPMKINHTY